MGGRRPSARTLRIVGLFNQHSHKTSECLLPPPIHLATGTNVMRLSARAGRHCRPNTSWTHRLELFAQ
ncbi:unnamed protein product [Haemonchus placei]|uniref:Uncharacterized protein n=1 Tax=Haemonchus placei TaxID=6290 RepID=A0A0N4WF39_HAEPC|nr:unnamed protein product [Haemonchus placei]